MPGAAFAEGESVVLRTIETEDVPFLQRWRNHADVRRPLTDVDPRNEVQLEEYVEDRVSGDGPGFGFLVCAQDRAAARQRMAEYDGEDADGSEDSAGSEAAVDREDSAGGETADDGETADGAAVDDDADAGEPGGEDDPVPVGAVHMPWIREPHGSGMLMYWVAPPHQGHGYVTEATELLLDYAFAERRIAKAGAYVLASNEGSQRVLEKLGFQREGVQREEVFVDGERRDNYYYGLLAEEWLADAGD